MTEVAQQVGCTYAACHDPEEMGCNRGDVLADCPHRQEWLAQQGRGESTDGAAAPSGVDPVNKESERDLRLPWTGNALGTKDVELVSASNRTSLIGVVGPFNAGKTTLLTLMYLLTVRGEQIPDWRFAASTTLKGWGRLADNLRWNPGDVAPKFPEHTSRGIGRRPGLLHLGIRNADNTRNDFLLTDPPGEWFSDWATKADHEGAEGARWIARYADRFLFLIDRKALASEDRGTARESYRELARRLAEARGDRPVAIVWTKSDTPIPASIEASLKDTFARELPGHVEFTVRTRFGNEPRSDVEEACLTLMRWVFAPPQPATAGLVEDWRGDTQDPFLNYRG